MHILKSTLNEHRGYICLAALLLAMLFFASPVSAFSGSGAGSVGDPYQITTTGQWNEMNGDNAKYYVLMNDLDFAGATPTQAGVAAAFTGQLNGNSKVIKNIVVPYASDSGKMWGLWYKINGGSIYDLAIVNADATVDASTSGSRAGILVARVLTSTSTFSRVFIDSTSSTSFTGADHNGLVSGSLIGRADSTATVSDCASLADINGDSNGLTGGITGYLETPSGMTKTYYGGTVNGNGGATGNIVGGVGSGNVGNYVYYDSTKNSATTHGETAKTTSNLKTSGNLTGYTYDSTHYVMSYSGSVWVGYPIYYNTGENLPPPSPPVAEFTFNRNATLANRVVAFTDTSTNTPTSWLWRWGDGLTNGTTQNPSHTFPANTGSTIYTVNLTATNSAGSSSTTRDVRFTTTTPTITKRYVNLSTDNLPYNTYFTTDDLNLQVYWTGDINSTVNFTYPNSATTYASSITSMADLGGSNQYGLGGINAIRDVTGSKTYYFTVSGRYGTDSTASNTSIIIGDPISVVDRQDTLPWTAYTNGAAFLPSVNGDVIRNSSALNIDWGDGTAVDHISYTHAAYPGSNYWDVVKHTYAAIGDYPVSVWAYDVKGIPHYKNSTMTVTLPEIPPVANFNADSTAAHIGDSIHFTDTSSIAPTSWEWSFGDGTANATTQNPTHTYTTAGTYTVTLTATNGYGSDSEQKAGYIVISYETPVAAFTFAPSAGFTPLTIAFTDTTTKIPTSWGWNFGDGGTSAAQSPTHTYTSAGTFTVNLTATNPGGSGSITHTVNVSLTTTPNPPPNGTPTLSGMESYGYADAPSLIIQKSLPSIVTGRTLSDPTHYWIGDSVLAMVNTTGITTVTYGGHTFNIDRFELQYWQQTMDNYNAWKTPIQHLSIPLGTKDTYVYELDGVGHLPDQYNPGDNPQYEMILFAVNNSYVAATYGNTNYGDGIIPLSAYNTTVDTPMIVEFAEPRITWNWTAMATRNPILGDTITLNWNMNSFRGCSDGYDDIYYLYLAESLNGGTTAPAVSGYPELQAITGLGSKSYVVDHAGWLYAYMRSGEDVNQMNNALAAPYPLIKESVTSGASFTWQNVNGATITGCTDTDTIKFGLDTGNVMQSNGYDTVSLYFQKYNTQTGVWDTLSTSWSGFSEFTTNPGASGDTDYSHTATNRRVLGYGDVVVNTDFREFSTAGNYAGRYRAVMMGDSNVILISKELTVTRNAINPSNAANGLGGFLGLGEGLAPILVGTLITLVISIVAFLFIRDARVFIIGALMGVGTSYALGLFPLWLIVIVGIIGLAVMLFASGILGGKGDTGGSAPTEG